MQLDDDNAVNDMEMRVRMMWYVRDDGYELYTVIFQDFGNGDKHLFVSTQSKIYRIPLERCSRHRSCR